MNQIVEQCTKIILLNKPNIPEKIAIQAVHYTLSMAASLKRITLIGLDDQVVPINYYGITFANSGRGKDLSASIAKEMVKSILDRYRQRRDELIVANKAKGLEIEAIPEIEYKEGTSSGLLQDRNILDILDIGCTNIRVEELVSVLKSGGFEDVMNILTESWESGYSMAKSFRSYQSPEVKGVPSNCLLYSSPEGFRTEGNKQFQGFVDNLANGMARRSYIVFDESDVEIEPEPTEESLQKHIANIKLSREMKGEMHDYIFDIIMNGVQQIKSTEASELTITRYNIKNNNIVAKSPLMKNAVKAELLNRAYKIRRLAALYALYDGNDEITSENIEDAIEWVEMLNRDIVIALNAETVSEKIYDYLKKVQRYSSQTDVMKFYKLSAKDFKENIDEVYTVAYDDGSTLQTKVFDKEAKVVKYNLIRGELTDPDNMICSTSDAKAHNYVQQNIGYKQLPGLVKGEYGQNYSAGIFLNQHRNIDNYIKRQNLIIFDIDEETTIEEAKIYLSKYRGFIATTRNHMKEKNGKIEERFRVVLVSKYIFNLEHEEYTSTLKNFALIHNLEIDHSAVEPARFYFAFPDSEITYLEGEELIDLRSYIPETKEVKDTERAIEIADKHYNGNEKVDGLDKYFLMQTAQGNRNNNLARYGFALITRKGLDIEEAKAKVLALNNMLIDPLKEIELERTVFKSMAKK